MASAPQKTTQIGVFGFLIFWLAEQPEKSTNLWLDKRRPAPLIGLCKDRIAAALDVMICNDLIIDYVIFPRHILVTRSARFEKLRHD